MKKIIALCLILSLVAIFISGCEQKDKAESSSLTVAEQSSSETSTSSSVKTTISRPEKTSSSTSSEIKQYKKNDGLMLGCLDLRPENCTYLGDSKKERLAEFESIVNAGYFNTYFLKADDYFLDAVRIIAEAGGSVWIVPNTYSSESGKSLDEHNNKIYACLSELKAEGLYNIVNGFFWDSPIWVGKYKNQDLLEHTEYLYKEYGLRNYTLFARGEFTDPNASGWRPEYKTYSMEEYDRFFQISPEAAKYVTDICYWLYGIDIRDGADYSEEIRYWKDDISQDVVDAKSYYVECAKKLKAHIKHKVNYWYSSLCWGVHLVKGALNGIEKADEDYCTAHLEFMVQNLLQEENAGGIIIDGYKVKDENGLEQYNDITDENGKYLLYPEQKTRYTKYCELLRKTTVKFNSTKPTLVKLDV